MSVRVQRRSVGIGASNYVKLHPISAAGQQTLNEFDIMIKLNDNLQCREYITFSPLN